MDVNLLIKKKKKTKTVIEFTLQRISVLRLVFFLVLYTQQSNEIARILQYFNVRDQMDMVKKINNFSVKQNVET